MFGLAALDILRVTTSEHLPTRVVFLALSVFDPSISAAIAKGAFGLIPAEATSQVLIQSLRQVGHGTIRGAIKVQLHHLFDKFAMRNRTLLTSTTLSSLGDAPTEKE